MVLINEPELRYQLNMLGSALYSAHVPIADYRGPGELQETVVAVLEAEGLRVDPQVVTVFMWASGYRTPRPNDTWVTPQGVQLIPLEQALRDYHESVLTPKETALPGWFPVMRIHTGYVLVDCSPEHASPGAARIFVDAEAYPPVKDLATIVSWWRERYEDGRWAHTAPGIEHAGWLVTAEADADLTSDAFRSGAV